MNCRICESSNLWTQVAVFSRKPCLPEGCLNTNWGLCLFNTKAKKRRDPRDFSLETFVSFSFLWRDSLEMQDTFKENSFLKPLFLAVWNYFLQVFKQSNRWDLQKSATFFNFFWKGKRKYEKRKSNPPVISFLNHRVELQNTKNRQSKSSAAKHDLLA